MLGIEDEEDDEEVAETTNVGKLKSFGVKVQVREK